jgi:hypothetical protein
MFTVPHLKICLTLWSPFQNWEALFVLDKKKLSLGIYLALISLYQVSLGGIIIQRGGAPWKLNRDMEDADIKQRLWTHGTGTNRNIVSTMMYRRKAI